MTIRVEHKGGSSKMKEYSFLCSKSWRTKHVKAINKSKAWQITKAWYLSQEKKTQDMMGWLTDTYSVEDGEGCMSEWRSGKGIEIHPIKGAELLS